MTRLTGISKEFQGANLGDRRLNDRLVQLATNVATAPADSFPRMAENDSDLEATYRFLGNDRISPKEMLAPHQRQTALRAASATRVIVPHDTTEFNYGRSARRDLGWVGQGKSHGFYAHVALVVDGGEHREPLGVAAIEVLRRTAKKKRRSHATLQTATDNEFQRWHRGVDEAEAVVGHLSPVHVMDREADSYAFMAELITKKRRFVVRMASDKRRLTDGETVNTSLARAPAKATREVPISQRKASAMPSYKKHFPPRIGRDASLEIRATQVTVKRPDSANLCPHKSITLNIVHVFEPEPPEGQAAVEWRLWTTESVESEEDVLAVVDAYRARWRIEEFFKALKTGCALEQRQLETHEGLVRALALFAPIAWRLLSLRSIAQRDETTPASQVLSRRQIRCLAFGLQHIKKQKLPDSPTAREAMFAIAKLGGHLKRNGSPGWQTLGRGLDTLLTTRNRLLDAPKQALTRDVINHEV